MALVLKNKLYGNINLDSNKIIGIMGGNINDFIKSINKNNISFVDKEDDFHTNNVINEMLLYSKDEEEYNDLINEFGLDSSFLKKEIYYLSSSEKKILKYIIAILQNKKIVILNEPFLDLDYRLKKKIISMIKQTIYETSKTIIIISNNSDIIYTLCDNVLLLGKDYCYGKVKDIFTNSLILKKYDIVIPNIVEFVNLVKNKSINLDYSFDIRDLIKDVYKNV